MRFAHQVAHPPQKSPTRSLRLGFLLGASRVSKSAVKNSAQDPLTTRLDGLVHGVGGQVHMAWPRHGTTVDMGLLEHDGSILRAAHESAVAHGHSKNPHQAAKNSSRKAYDLINTSAGKLSWLTKRRIISSVKGRVRFKMSATRPRGPMIGSRSLRLKP